MAKRIQTKDQRLTHAQVQGAVQQFLRKGGHIQKLPDQVSVSGAQVGQEYSTTEMDRLA